MKRISLTCILLFGCYALSSAQNYYPGTGTVGIGTSTQTNFLGLNLVYPYSNMKLEGAGSSNINLDLVITRTSAVDALGKSPNIAFSDVASNIASYIQAYQGNMSFWAGGSVNTRLMTIFSSGRLGLGTATPYSTLQVDAGSNKFCIGSANNTTLNGTSYIGFNAGRNTTDQWRVEVSNYGGGVIYGDKFGNINFATLPTSGSGGFVNFTDADIKSHTYFQVSGTGVARAKVVKVELTGWSDYVFDKGYKLPSLQSVKKYINQNHHLPDMPSASEVVSDGLDVGEMNKLLMKKVEEVTLYLIDAEQLNKEQKKTLERQEQRIKALEEKLNMLLKK